MEMFIPTLLLFLVAIGISLAIVPKFSPLVIAVLSIVFLTVGVYQHYKMFAAEYRLSTWQNSLKMYAPAIMIGAVILFVIYSILAIFPKGSVPVPSLPNITPPSTNSITNQVVGSLNKVTNILGNTTSDLVETVNNTINKINNRGEENKELGVNTENQANKANKNKNNLSRSFLETI
jgi:hypothetical protein